MAQQFVLATSLFGVLLVAVTVYLTEGWRHDAPSPQATGSAGSRVVQATHEPWVWTLSFLVAALAFGMGTLAFINGSLTPLSGAMGTLLAVAGAFVLVGYLFYGTFVAARGRGVSDSLAAAIGAWVVGIVGVVAVVVHLFGVL